MSRRKVQQYLTVLIAASAISWAQNLATVSGVVTDPAGAVVPQAHVTATNLETKVLTETQTNKAGLYNIQNLPIGIYSVAVEHPGFSKYLRPEVTLTTGEVLGLNVQLALGATGQTVTVNGEPPPLETRTSDLTTLIESKSIDSLPLGNRRTLNAVQLSGAAVFVSYPNTPANVNPNFSLAGGRTQSQMAWIDGGNAQNMRMGVGQINLDPPVEAVQEIKVLSNNYEAEYGASAGGVIVETTKSGTNQFHGSAYEFLRNNYMDAPGYFAPVQNGYKVEPELRYNVFGGTVGGPIRKDKTFFFFDYEGQRLRTGSGTVLTVPTLQQRTGDFSRTLTAAGAVIPIFDPNSTQLVNGANVRTQFPGNIIPASELDPVALKVMNYYPLPSQAPSNAAGANNFNGNQVAASPDNFYMIKADHAFREQDKLSGYFMRTAGTGSQVSVYPNNGAGDPTNFAANIIEYVYTSWTHIVNPSQVNDLRFTYNNRIFHNESEGLGGNYPSKLGLQGVPDDAFPTWAPMLLQPSRIHPTGAPAIPNPPGAVRRQLLLDSRPPCHEVRRRSAAVVQSGCPANLRFRTIFVFDATHRTARKYGDRQRPRVDAGGLPDRLSGARHRTPPPPQLLSRRLFPGRLDRHSEPDAQPRFALGNRHPRSGRQQPHEQLQFHADQSGLQYAGSGHVPGRERLSHHAL